MTAISPLPPSLGAPSTPGRCLAEALASIPEVRLIAEQTASGHTVVLVLLDCDSESLLDAIFAAEQPLYARFPRTPFEVHVTTPGPDWDEGDLPQDASVLYDRAA